MANQITRGTSNLLEELFRDVAPGFFVRPLHGDPLPTASQIRLDVSESAAAYTVHAEIPGVVKEDIQVSIDGAVVTLAAEIKQHDSETKDNKVLRSERYYGSVSRSFQLPVEIDQANAKAKYDNGVLTLTLPKKQASGAQRLAIE